ncbi:MAG: ABC transporter ATP-binding protein [Planctomycetota bacterium]
MTDTLLQIRGVSKSFGDTHVLHDLNFDIEAGSITALVGPSGCGKSTLLNAILGTVPQNVGSIKVDGREVDGPGRDRGIVYQRYTLFPYLTARKNVAIGPILDSTHLWQRLLHPLRTREMKRKWRGEADKWLAKVGLADAADRYPSELSGGMRQRVAIAQAMILRPSILLLDEPFGALDEATREELQDMLLGFYAENQAAKAAGKRPPHTILIVTHELNEAILVSDRILGLSQYWNWQGAGHAECPGATIVYDEPAPIFAVGDERKPESFYEQRHAIRRIVFEPEMPVEPVPRDKTAGAVVDELSTSKPEVVGNPSAPAR